MDQPQHLHEFPVHLAADGPAGRLVSWHPFDCSWDSWEMHPRGDEIVLCLEGAIELVQEVGSGIVKTALGSGQWAINKAGTWHTADVSPDSTASCVFITSGLGTQHRAR